MRKQKYEVAFEAFNLSNALTVSVNVNATIKVVIAYCAWLMSELEAD